MNWKRNENAVTGVIFLTWLYTVLTIVEKTMFLNPVVFPIPTISTFKQIQLILLTLSLVFLLILKAIPLVQKLTSANIDGTKSIMLVLLLCFSTPFVSAYIFDSDFHSLGQMIIDLGGAVMDEDFDDTPPGEDPPGWSEESGNWYAIDDGGNMVYYNDDDGDQEALTISTTGDTSWTDYSLFVDVKFDEGPTNKADRAALLVYRYTGGNDYYYLAMREAQDLLEIYKHGSDSVGHRVGSVSCTLVQHTWYAVNITIRGNNVWVSVDDTFYFTEHDMLGAHSEGSVGIGTHYYKVMFDDIIVELR